MERKALRWLVPPLLLLIVAAALLLRPHWSYALPVADVPAETERRELINYFGVGAAERSDLHLFRRTGDQLTLALPFALRAQPLAVELTLCACRPDGGAQEVQIFANNRHIATLLAVGPWRSYRVLIPADLQHPDHSLFLRLTTPPWTAPDGRELGVALEEVRAAELPQPRPWLAPWALLPLLAGLALWLRGATLRPLLLALGWAALWLAYTPELLPREALGALYVVGALLLWAVARWAPAHPLVGAGLAGWLTYGPQLLGRWVLDDAYISFRYAEQLLAGNGLVFNAGERVEGYTNFLWTMIMAGAMALGLDPVAASLILTALLGYAIVGLTALLAERLAGPRWGWAATLPLALSTPFMLYTVRGGGMETALFAALLLAALLALAHERWALAGALTALTLLTRPDGALLAAAGGLYALWASRRARRWLPVLRFAGVALLIFGPYYAWRWSYYGYPLPNTFYVKVGGTAAQLRRGLGYLAETALSEPLLAGGIVALLAGLAVERRSAERRPVALVGGLVGLSLLYIAVVGGDWMPGARFVVPLLAPLAVLAAWGLSALARRSRWVPVAALALIALLQLPALPRESSYNQASLVWREVRVVRRYREVGSWLREHTPQDALIVVTAAGALPFYAQRPAIDALGLNDLHIAHLPSDQLGTGKPGHEKEDPAYVLGRRPAIVPYLAAPALTSEPDFERLYRLETFDGPEGAAVQLYIRNDYELGR